MTLHAMIDLETFGTAKDSVILQLAAVQFSQDFHILAQFNEVISPESCQEAGLSIDLDTVMWWMTQSEEAKQKVVLQGARSPLKEALRRFHEWLPRGTRVWGNGASFDLSILDTAYRKVGYQKPWSHLDERCYRTINSLVGRNHPERPPFEGTKHNALDDCKYQIRQLKFVTNLLGLELI